MDTQLLYFIPLLIASLFALFTPIIDVFSGSNKKIIFYTTLLNFILIIVANLFLLTQPEFATPLVNINQTGDFLSEFLKNSIVLSSYTIFFDLIFAVAGLLTLFGVRQYLIRENYEQKEFYSLLCFSFLGMMLIAHSNSLVILFLGIETMSIPFYVLSGFIRNKTSNIEASLKYFLLGAFATGFLVYGMAMIYGSTGSLDLSLIHTKIMNNQFNTIYLAIGIGLLIVGLSFKASTFPFHQWAPDVYTGAPTVVSAFMSTAGKSAAFVAFIIIAKAVIPMNLSSAGQLTHTSNFITQYFREILAVIAAFTMLVGNITALMQTNVKRMLAFSSVAHAGYMMMGIVANNSDGWSGIIFYASAYVLMQIGAFIIVSLIEKENDQQLELSDYNGLSKNNPFLAASMAIFMLSLAGIPPFAGFFGKYFLFYAAIESGYLWLTIVAVIATLISLYFYIGLIVNMYFKTQSGEIEKVHIGLANISVIISVIGVIFLGLFPNTIMNFAILFFK
ncbi:MAG: NADH-quinone oxidoreductase subunit N [Chloroherpetonaceae bacterium]